MSEQSKSEKVIEDRMPQPVDLGRGMETTLDTIKHHYDRYLENLAAGTQIESDEVERYVCGYPLPSFQRELKWTDDQCVRFLESAWKQLLLGTYVVHAGDWDSHGAKRFTDWLIDGQQRFHALQRYWDDELRVNGLLWSELRQREQYRFLHAKFAGYKAEIWNEAGIREFYNMMNFGGVAHEDHERA